MKRINIGLDLGIGSVGWAVVNAEKFEILDAGSRLFPEANKEGENTAVTRREKRSVRRMTRRKKLRLEDLKRLFIKYNLLKDMSDFDQLSTKRFSTLVELRCYALECSINLEEMLLILFSLLKKRGSFNLKEDLLDDEKNQEKSEAELEQIVQEQSKKFPCLIQLENLKNNGKMIGSENKFSHQMFKNELVKILEKQKKLNSFILSDIFIQEYFELFDRKREYYEGPDEPSPFSWGGSQEEFYNRLIGQDTYALNESRTAKKGMYAALFNLLNDLNQIEINDEIRSDKKISQTEKEMLVKHAFEWLPKKGSRNLTLKSLAKLLGVKENNISGYRIDKDKKANFTKFEGLNDLYDRLTKVNLDTNWLSYQNIDLIDQVLNLVTKFQSIDATKKALIDLLKITEIPHFEKVAETISLMTKNYNGSHSLSNYTILRVLPLMWAEPKMSQVIFADQGIKKQYKFKFDDSFKYIPVLKDEINNLFISPVVKRTLIQALHVLKAIQIEYRAYEIDSVVIEMAREKNSDDYKKFLTKMQGENEKIKKDINLYLLKVNAKTNPKLNKKIYLAMEQNEKCPYCLKEIDPGLLLSDDNAYEIDHIIPESISLNSKKENLVLVHGSENHQKGKRTAYQYINSKDSKISWAQFLFAVDEIYDKSPLAKNNPKYLARKKALFKDDTNFDDPEKRLEFINRNLNDTRYSTSEVRTYLEEFRKNNENTSYKLKTLNGSYTDFIKREIFNLSKKDRDDFKHHGIDAIAIAYSDIIKQKIFQKRDIDLVKEEYAKYGNEIQNFDFKFSKKANRNFNKQLANDTLYSFKKVDNEFKQVNKISLFSDNTKVLDKIFITKELITPLGVNDARTFSYLVDIYQAYPVGRKYIEEGKEFTIKNPFVYFTKVLKEKIFLQKNIKNPELNPEIKTIKYYGDAMGKMILDVTDKYQVDSEKTKIGFTSLKPIRLDLYQHKLTKRYKVFPVNARVISKINEKEIIINQDEYNEVIQNKTYGYEINLNEYEKVMELFPRGDLIRITSKDGKYNNEIFEVVGSPNIGKIEVDYYKKRKNKEEARLIIAVGVLVKIEKVHSNILGNKMKFIEKEIFSDKMKACVRT